MTRREQQLADPGRVYEGSVILAGVVTGGHGLVSFKTEQDALRWLLQPLETGGWTQRPGRRLVRFQVANLVHLKAVLPGFPVLEE